MLDDMRKFPPPKKNADRMLLKIFILLFQIGFGLKFHLIGEMSASEIFLIVSSFYYVPRVLRRRNVEIRSILKLIFFLIVVQIITEILSGNTFNNSARGIAVNIVALFHISFLYYYVSRDYKLIAYFALGLAFNMLLFGGLDETGMTDPDDSSFVKMLKFTLVPLLNGVLIFLALKFRMKSVNLLFIYLGLLFIALGARSGGGIWFISGTVSLLSAMKTRLNFRYVKVIVLVSCFFFYGAYCLYVDNVISGNITAGNSTQIQNMKNPYNPVELLESGRPEVFTGFYAFLDAPLVGHGAWAKDPNYRYHQMVSDISRRDFNYANIMGDEIPTHSVLIGTGAFNGVFALILMLLIFCKVVGRGVWNIKQGDPLIIVSVFYLINFIWNMLFSPLSYFRYYAPLDIVVILTFCNRIKERMNSKLVQL